jgi:hypothetical protein
MLGAGPQIDPLFVHNKAADDCRNPANANQAVFTAGYFGYDGYLVNLAEVEFNEAGPPRPWGAVDAVGWAVRDRVFENDCIATDGVNLDTACAADNTCQNSTAPLGASFFGGCGWHTNASCPSGSICRTSGGPCFHLPVGQAYPFDVYSQNFCCSVHGGTFHVGNSQSQFDDHHDTNQTLYDDGYIGAASYMLSGLLPDMSVKVATGGYWVTDKATNCQFNCSSPICNDPNRNQTGAPFDIWNITVGSPDGPVEFMTCPWYNPAHGTVEYQPSDPGNGWTTGNICGGGNCFANRCTTPQPPGGACN